MLLVTLREGIEMFLIVALAATYLRKSGRVALLSAVSWGTATAVAASVVLGTWLAEVAVLPKWEALLALVAAVLVITMVIYMLKAAKHLRRDIGARLEAAAVRTGRGAWLGVFLFVVLMVTREGMETAFITASLFRQTDTAHFALGAFGGLSLAAALAWTWVRYGQLVNLALTDTTGQILVEGKGGVLGYTCPQAGEYVLSLHDRDYRGGADVTYRLHAGPIPVEQIL